VHGPDVAPSSTVLASLDLVPARGKALDLAMGRGRHALALARRGFDVLGIDRDAEAVNAARFQAEREGLRLACECRDIEAAEFTLAPATFDLVLVVNYLWRPGYATLVASLKPGAFLLYETYTLDQARFGRPTNPDFLLAPGELRAAFAMLEPVVAWEGIVRGLAARAHLLARKPHGRIGA